MSDMLNEKFEEFVTEQKVIVEAGDPMPTVSANVIPGTGSEPSEVSDAQTAKAGGKDPALKALNAKIDEMYRELGLLGLGVDGGCDTNIDDPNEDEHYVNRLEHELQNIFRRAHLRAKYKVAFKSRKKSH